MDTLNNTTIECNFLSTSITINIETSKDNKYSFTKILQVAQRLFAHPVQYQKLYGSKVGMKQPEFTFYNMNKLTGKGTCICKKWGVYVIIKIYVTNVFRTIRKHFVDTTKASTHRLKNIGFLKNIRFSSIRQHLHQTAYGDFQSRISPANFLKNNSVLFLFWVLNERQDEQEELSQSRASGFVSRVAPNFKQRYSSLWGYKGYIREVYCLLKENKPYLRRKWYINGFIVICICRCEQ